HTRSKRDWSSDVCSSDLRAPRPFRRNRAEDQDDQISKPARRPCTNRVPRSPREKEFQCLDSWERKEDLNFRIKIESANFYMAERSEERRVGKECRCGRRQ